MDPGSMLILAVVIGLVVLSLIVGRSSGGGPPHTGTDVRASIRDDNPGGWGGGDG